MGQEQNITFTTQLKFDFDRSIIQLSTLNDFTDFIKSIFPDAEFQVKTQDGCCLVDIVSKLRNKINVNYLFLLLVAGGVATYAIKEHEKNNRVAIEKGIAPSPIISVSIGALNNSFNNNLNIRDNLNKIVNNGYTATKKDVEEKVSKNIKNNNDLDTYNNFVKTRNKSHKSINSEKPESFSLNGKKCDAILDENYQKTFELEKLEKIKSLKDKVDVNIDIKRVEILYDGKPHISFTKEKTQELIENNEDIKKKIDELKKKFEEEIEKQNELRRKKKEEKYKEKNCKKLFENF